MLVCQQDCRELEGPTAFDRAALRMPMKARDVALTIDRGTAIVPPSPYSYE